MFLLLKKNLCSAVTLALCVSWNSGSHPWSQYQPIIRNKCRDTCFQLSSPEVFKNWTNKIKLFHILWSKNYDYEYVLNFKWISSPTICGIKAIDGSKCDCTDRFGLQEMKICWEDSKIKPHINYQLILPCDSSNFFCGVRLFSTLPPLPKIGTKNDSVLSCTLTLEGSYLGNGIEAWIGECILEISSCRNIDSPVHSREAPRVV